MTTETQRAFAKRIGVRPGYVTELKKAGRLVMSGGGRRVDVELSLARIEDTRDASKQGVRERWEDHRRSRGPADGEKLQDPVAEIAMHRSEHPARVSFAEARARREHYQALKAQREYEQLVGMLADTASVRRVATAAGTAIRTAIEALWDRLAPEVAPVTDPDAVQAILQSHGESLLLDVAQQIGAIGRAVTVAKDADDAQAPKDAESVQ